MLIQTAGVGIGELVMDGEIVGDYAKYLSQMAVKHSQNKRVLNSRDDIIIIDSFDGTEHSRNMKDSTSIIHFLLVMHVQFGGEYCKSGA